MKNETKSAFEAVIKNAEILKSYSFKKKIKTIRMVWNWHKDKPDEVKIDGPNREQISAFLLTFRQFVQKKDRCSFKYLANNIFDDPGISQEWKFIQLRNQKDD